MKNRMSKTKRISSLRSVTKSISMPRDLWDRIKAKLETDPELDFSTYARRLMRVDTQCRENSDLVDTR